MKALAATWRFHQTGLEPWEPPFIFVLWHSRFLPLLALPALAELKSGPPLPYHPVPNWAQLPDGWNFGECSGVSTQRGGEVGLLGIVRALQEGAIVAVTPDGPRGPRERVKPGAIAAAQHAGVPIVAVGTQTQSAWYLQSWDRMCIPKPFAAIDVRYAPPVHIGPGEDGLRQGIAALERNLHAVNGTSP